MLFGQRVQQVAYVVDNVWEAAARHSQLYGSGPFFAIDDTYVSNIWFRGTQTDLTSDLAFGQCGDVMIELIADKTSGPSIFHDLYPEGSGRFGIHHLCFHVDNVEAAVSEFEAQGFPLAFRCTTDRGTVAVFIDTTKVYGHFIELYERTDEIRETYALIREAAQGFDGRNPVRPMAELGTSTASFRTSANS